MADGRSGLLKVLGVYLSTAVLLIGAIGFVALAIVIPNLLAASDIQSREPTRLQEAIETARDIRRALATPIPPPTPLSPIPAKVQRLPASTVGSPAVRSLPREAAASYAQQTRRDFSTGRNPEIHDRHAVMTVLQDGIRARASGRVA